MRKKGAEQSNEGREVRAERREEIRMKIEADHSAQPWVC